MEKKVKFIILWLIFFGGAVLLVILLGAKLRGTIIDNILIGIGFLVLIVGFYFCFRSKKPFFFMIFGQVLIFGGYFFLRFFLSHHYDELSVVLMTIFVILGALFTFIAVFYSFKELIIRWKEWKQ